MSSCNPIEVLRKDESDDELLRREIWKDVIGYEGLYLVSNTKKVRVVRTGQLLKQYFHQGYRAVRLSKGNKKTSHYVHRLVAMAFLSNPENKPFINHKNGNREDCTPGNLEWCTAGENHRHARDVLKREMGGKRRLKESFCKLPSISVARLDKTGKIIEFFDPPQAAANATGVVVGGLYQHLNGIKKSYAGSQWCAYDGDICLGRRVPSIYHYLKGADISELIKTGQITVRIGRFGDYQ